MTKPHINHSTTRKRWIFLNPPVDGYWYCHYDGVPLTIDKDLLAMGVEPLVLDHKFTRSERPDLKYDTDNLLPACWNDNSRRGSMKYETYCKRYYPLRAMI